jgi:hypothetical protein
MPQAVVAAVVATGATWAGAAIAGTALAAGVLTATFVTTLVLSGISMALTKKPKIPTQATMLGRSQMVKQPITSRKIVYGRQKVSGAIVFMETSGKSQYLHIIVAIAGNELNSIQKVFLNDAELTLDSDGNVTAPSKLSGKAIIKTQLGAADQAHLNLAQFGAIWPSTATLKGIAFIYARLEYDTDAFPNGIPNISAIVEGKKVYDPRTTSSAYSKNSALILRDYLTNTEYGVGATSDEVDDASFIAAANVCDENVTLAAGGTEKRYESHGVVDTANAPKQVIEEMLSAMAGTLTYSGGKFYVKAGAYSSPSDTLTEDDLRSGISIVTKPSRRDNFNAVKGVFLPDETGNFQPTDYASVTSSTFETEDGSERVFSELDLTFTQSSSMAQRIAKIALFKSRQQLVIAMPCKLTAFKHNIGDTVMVTLDRYGFSSKVFEVTNWSFANGVDVNGNAELGVDLTLRELASSVYDWNAEETAFVADNTNLRSPSDLLTPAVSATDEVRIINEEVLTVLLVDVTTSDFLAQQVEVQAKKQSDSQFTTLGISTFNEAVRFEMIDVEDGVTYDVRARTISSLGNRSAFATTTRKIFGKTDIPSNVTNLSVNIIGKEAHLSWTPVTDLDLSHYIVRHSSATTGATFITSRTIADKISRPANTAVVPGLTGTYLIKAFDKGGRESRNAASSIVTIDSIEAGNLISTITESPAFSGTKTDTVVVDDKLILTTTSLFDSVSGNFDDAEGLFDGGSSTVDNEGFYNFVGVDGDASIDLGSKFTSRITSKLVVNRIDYVGLFEDADGDFDTREGFFDGDVSEFGDTNAKLQIATTDGDPAGSPSYTDFRDFVVGEYTFRAAKFRAVLNSKDTSATPRIDTLQVTIDMPDRLTHGNDVSSGTGASGLDVTFSPAFSVLQNVAITAQNMNSGDFYTITNKSATGFTIVFKNSSSAVVDRTFDFQAKGYGAVVS